MGGTLMGMNFSIGGLKETCAKYVSVEDPGTQCELMRDTSEKPVWLFSDWKSCSEWSKLRKRGL